ncbi:MAG: DNA primase [Lachnospiraceae bacterium]|nr:DNA primase [Lachnospiraceae bacterium]
MYYPDNLVEEVRTRNDIVDVISSYVRLQKKGSNHFGLCPFHNEKSPSFSVNQARQMYHCFGCGKSGNVITFIMEYENYTFQEALKLLADRAGVTLPEIEYSARDRERDNLKARILEAYKEAGKYYYYQLRSEAGKRAYEYFTGRGLSDDTLKKFGLGYAVTGRNLMYRYLKSKGYDDNVLKEMHIFYVNEREGMTDMFWNRAIFPIMDVNHRIIAFGGRVMGKGEPKYLNSPETMIFDKGRNLYGLNHARTSRKGNIIVCEGYMDVISLHQAGFDQAVGSLGTALTSGHVNLLKRYTDNVLLCYDNDEAGKKANLRAIPLLRAAGIPTKVLDLSPYKDPDEFLKELGPEEFEKRIENAGNPFYYEVGVLETGYDLNDPDGRTRFTGEVAKMLLKFEDAIERDNYLEGICKRYRINADNMRKLLAKLAARGEGLPEYEKPRSTSYGSKKDPEGGIKKAQRLLLTWLCEEPEIYKKISRYLSSDDFSGDIYRTVAQILFEQINEGKVNPAGIISRFTNEEEQSEVGSLFNTKLDKLNTKAEKEKAFKDILLKVKTHSLDLKAREADPTDIDLISTVLENKKILRELGELQIELSEDTEEQ